MKIFIGSSREALASAELVASWAEAAGHQPELWKEPGVFRWDASILSDLVRLSKEVDGAVFLFARDDRTIKRGSAQEVTRDNVLFEYGLFLGRLGRDRVRRILVGRPGEPDDLKGLTTLRIPEPGASDKGALPRAERALAEWLGKLLPVYLTDLAHERLKSFERNWAYSEALPVREILLSKAPDLLQESCSKEVNAVCSNKGEHGEQYYLNQFGWARKDVNRKVKRLFVQRHLETATGFSDDEARGIRLHLDHRELGVEARWIDQCHELLGETFSDSLGFALFGNSWILHWGTSKGWFFDVEAAEERRAGEDIGNMLRDRFDVLWSSANKFDPQLEEEIREQDRQGGRES